MVPRSFLKIYEGKYLKRYFALSRLLESDFQRFILKFNKKVQSPRVPDFGVLSPGSQAPGPGTRVLGPTSWFLGPMSASWFPGPRSWVPGPGSLF